MEIELNTSVQNEHVPEIERLNRIIQEQIRSVYTELIRVYGCVPGVLVSKLIYDVTFWSNSFPAENGISATLIPRAMITDQSIKFTKHCLLEFGDYVHIHEDRDNSMNSQTLEALAICPTGHIQVSNYFLNIHTGRIITCFTWTALLLPTRICKFSRRLAWRSPIALDFLDGLQHEVPNAKPDNDKADEDYVPGEYDRNSDNDDDDGN